MYTPHLGLHCPLLHTRFLGSGIVVRDLFDVVRSGGARTTEDVVCEDGGLEVGFLGGEERGC